MADLNIATATKSDLTNRVDDWEVTQLMTDGVSAKGETTWTNSDWPTQWGYFNTIADLKAAILMKAAWVVGRGYTTEDTDSQVILDNITGWGKDTWEDILYNMEVTKRVGGNAYAEIIRNDEGTIINLKPLDPQSMQHVVNSKGILIRFEQISKLPSKSIKKFKPQDIFYLANNRLADQIHGISDITAVEDIIKANAESFSDIKKLMHRQARPMMMFKLGTDDQTKIDAFVTKMDDATNRGENIYIPDDENAVTYEVVKADVGNAVMVWRDDIRNSFFRAIGLPQIVPGASGQSTESESKVIYLAFEQLVQKDQREIERQIWEQLAIKIDLIHPASLESNMQQDQAKDAQQGLEFQQADVTAGVGR